MKLNRKITGTVLAATASVLILALTSGGVGVASAQGNNHNHNSSSASKGKLKTLGDDCNRSKLKLHDGFQTADKRCVGIEFGELSRQDKNPTLLITKAPASVAVNADIVLEVSTQNLVRDRFLAAADGGYYKESAFLNKDGFTRGHFHTGCRVLTPGTLAPEPLRLDAGKFVATEDKKGNGTPDVVTVTLKGFAAAGQVQCAAWAGDGSHRIPMMSFANEIPAFDAVRITVQ